MDLLQLFPIRCRRTKAVGWFKVVVSTEVDHGQGTEYFAVLIPRKLAPKTKGMVYQVREQTVYSPSM